MKTDSSGAIAATAFLGIAFLATTMAMAQTSSPAASIDPALTAKAEAGEAQAEMAVGEAYAKATGRAQDCKTAAEWFARPAAKGRMEAILRLAALYRDGCRNLPRNPAASAIWYKKAAEAGDVGAQGTLGTLYSFGQGVAQDYKEAYFWLDLAAHTPGPRQQQYAANRQLVGTHLTTDEVATTKERVADWIAAHARPAAQ